MLYHVNAKLLYIYFFFVSSKLDNQDRDPADRGKNLLVDAFGGKGNVCLNLHMCKVTGQSCD